MVNKKLSDILDFLEEKIKGQDFGLRFETNVFLEILERKKEKFKDFQDDIRLRWDEFNQKNQKRVIKKPLQLFSMKIFMISLDIFYNFFLDLTRAH